MIFQVAQFELNVVFHYVEPLEKHCLVITFSSSNTKSCLSVCSRVAVTSLLNIMPGNIMFRYALAGRPLPYSCLQPFVYMKRFRKTANF